MNTCLTSSPVTAGGCYEEPDSSGSLLEFIKESYKEDCKWQHDTIQETTITVPILKKLPHFSPWTPVSSASTISVPSTPIISTFDDPDEWDDNTLMYLLNIIHLDSLHKNTLIFDPPLEALSHHPSPIHLRLWEKIPSDAVYEQRKYAPRGVPSGQALHLLRAQSAPHCATPDEARRSLAQCLLTNRLYVSRILEKHALMAMLYASEPARLEALARGIVEMLGTDGEELFDRKIQMRGHVDEASVLEVRLEFRLLGEERKEVEEWFKMVCYIGRMERRERRGFERAYGEGVGFVEALLREIEEGERV